MTPPKSNNGWEKFGESVLVQLKQLREDVERLSGNFRVSAKEIGDQTLKERVSCNHEITELRVELGRVQAKLALSGTLISFAVACITAILTVFAASALKG
jgi:hypothetical protein